MLTNSVVRTTLGVKHHGVKGVVKDEGGFTIDLQVWKGRRLPCGSCGTLGRCFRATV